MINALTSIQADITLDVAGIVRRNEGRSVGLRLGLYRVPCGRQISGDRPSDENCKYRESCHADIQAGESLMLNITASGNFTDRLKRAQIARHSVNRKSQPISRDAGLQFAGTSITFPASHLEYRDASCPERPSGSGDGTTPAHQGRLQHVSSDR